MEPTPFDRLLSTVKGHVGDQHHKAEHWQTRPVFWLVFVPLIFIEGPIIGLHVANPCINYAKTLFGSVTGVYCLTVFLFCCTTWYYITKSSYCDKGLYYEHVLDILATHFAMGSCLGFYDLYTYLPPNSAPFAALASSVQFIVAFGLLWISIIEKHRHHCLRKEEPTFTSGDQCYRGVFYTAYYFEMAAWASIIGLALGFDWELWQANSGRSPTACF